MFVTVGLSNPGVFVVSKGVTVISVYSAAISENPQKVSLISHFQLHLKASAREFILEKRACVNVNLVVERKIVSTTVCSMSYIY